MSIIKKILPIPNIWTILQLEILTLFFQNCDLVSQCDIMSQNYSHYIFYYLFFYRFVSYSDFIYQNYDFISYFRFYLTFSAEGDEYLEILFKNDISSAKFAHFTFNFCLDVCSHPSLTTVQQLYLMQLTSMTVRVQMALPVDSSTSIFSPSFD